MQNFGHKLRAFMWRTIEPKSTFVEKKWQISGLCNCEQICESTYRVQVPAYNVHLRLEEPVSPGRRLDARALVHRCSVECAVCIVTWVTPLLHHHLVGSHPTVVATSIIIKAEARSPPSQLWPCWQKWLSKKNKPLNCSIWQIWKQQGNVLRQRPSLHWFFFTGTSAWSYILCYCN